MAGKSLKRSNRSFCYELGFVPITTSYFSPIDLVKLLFEKVILGEQTSLKGKKNGKSYTTSSY